MTRQDFLNYIQNCILTNSIVTEKEIDTISNNRVAAGYSYPYVSQFRESIRGAVNYNGLYIKKTKDNKLILVYSEDFYEELDLGNMVDEIGMFALSACKKLVSVKGDKIISIHPFAFARNKGLKKVIFPKVRFIGVNAFLHCQIEEVRLKAPVIMANSAFTGANINSLYLPREVSIINFEAPFLNSSIKNAYFAGGGIHSKYLKSSKRTISSKKARIYLYLSDYDIEKTCGFFDNLDDVINSNMSQYFLAETDDIDHMIDYLKYDVKSSHDDSERQKALAGLKYSIVNKKPALSSPLIDDTRFNKTLKL